MKVLVTGGSGFIGSNLTRQLVKRGIFVNVLDDFSTGLASNLEGINPELFQLIPGSVLDRKLLTEASKGVDGIFHLAAAVGVFRILKNPLESFRVNTKGTENVLDTAEDFRTKVIIASSSEVYGKNSSSSLTEESDRVIGPPQIWRWSYSESKAIDEFLSLAYRAKSNLDVRIFRLFNTVGPGQLGDFGMVIPRLVRAALRGDDLEIVGDGNQTRCFLHVEDAIAGIQKIFDTPDIDGEIFNLGSPEEVSINLLAEKIISLSNSTSRISHVDPVKLYSKGFEDMRRRTPNVTKAESLLGWKPKRNLDHIICDVIRFEKKQLLIEQNCN